MLANHQVQADGWGPLVVRRPQPHRLRTAGLEGTLVKMVCWAWFCTWSFEHHFGKQFQTQCWWTVMLAIFNRVRILVWLTLAFHLCPNGRVYIRKNVQRSKMSYVYNSRSGRQYKSLLWTQTKTLSRCSTQFPCFWLYFPIVTAFMGGDLALGFGGTKHHCAEILRAEFSQRPFLEKIPLSTQQFWWPFFLF